MGLLAAIVLGAAAGGGFLQWSRIKPRTRASLAFQQTADG
jgi:hypothetical protein